MPTHALHHARHTVRIAGRRQQVHVVGHENPGVYRHVVFMGGLMQPVRVCSKILIGCETHLVVVAPLNDVLGYAWRAYAM